RSTQLVLDASNALMAEAPRQYRKHLLSIRGEGTVRPSLVTVEDLQVQAEYICTEVLRRRESNVPLRLQAVLIKDLMSVLRWADNPRNVVAGARALQLLPGFGPGNAKKIIELMQAQGYSFEALKSYSVPQAMEITWRRTCELMTNLADPSRQWQGQVNQVREWYRPHFERLYEHFHTRVGDLDQLELLSGQYPNRERFLTELTLDPPNATSDLAGSAQLDEEYLTLSTIHSAKGMEWDTVY